MKIFCRIILLLVAISLKAQNIIVIDYHLAKTIRTNSTAKNNVKYKLFINDNKSYFVSHDKIKKDSITQLINEGKISSLGAISHINLFGIDEIISYDSKKNILNTYKYLPQKPLFYKEDNKIKWTLTNTKKEIGKFLCHSAETEIFGKKWIAWYTTQYPLSEGPYKFKGLPGLVLEVYDTLNTFHYTFESIEQIENPLNLTFDDFKEIEKEKWKQIKQSYIENPLPELTKDLNFQTRESLRRASIENSKNLNEIE